MVARLLRKIQQSQAVLYLIADGGVPVKSNDPEAGSKSCTSAVPFPCATA